MTIYDIYFHVHPCAQSHVSVGNYMNFLIFIQNYYTEYEIRKITLKVWKVYVLRLKTWKCLSIVA